MARAGSSVEMSAWADSDVTAGQIDFWVEISTDGGDTWSNHWGTSAAPVVSLKSGGATAETGFDVQAKGTSTFAAGDVLRIRAVTDGTFSGGRRPWCQISVEC